MNVALSSQTQQLLEKKLQSGQYKSADELLHAALEALDQLEYAALDGEIFDKIDRAEEQIEQGQVHNWTDVRAQVRARFSGM